LVIWNLAHNLVSFNYLFGAATVAIIIIIVYCPIPANYHHNFYHPLERISFIAVAIAAAASVAAIIIIINDEVAAVAVAHYLRPFLLQFRREMIPTTALLV